MPEFAVDLHTHSRFFHAFHGRPTAYDSVGLRLHTLAARLRGLDAVAVTNHDYTYSAESGFRTLPGVEVSTTHGHVLVVGPDPPARPTQNELSPEEAVEIAHERGCIAILAHPFRNSSARESDADFDAVEVNGKNPDQAERSRKLAARRDLPLVGGSDAHYPVEVGRAYTKVEADSAAPADIVDAVRGGDVTAVMNFDHAHRLLSHAYSASHGSKGWMVPVDD